MRKYKKSHKKIILASVFLIVLILFFGNIILKALTFSPVFFNVVFNKQISLKKSNTNNDINVLLLGKGGGTHEGPDLTDTLIYTHIDPTQNTVSMVSIPRDLWIPELKGKINTAYAIGRSKDTNGGITLAKAVVSKVVNQPISYALVIDFDGFVKAVDQIGGLDIMVDRTFDDYQYPVEEMREDLCGHSLEEATTMIATQSPTIVFPCRYEHVHFEQGPTHLDGQQALIFVRSRYAQGVEGTDFARSQRQQKVIKAFKDKIFSLGILLNPIKISNLYSILANSIDTDITQDEFDDFIKLAQKMKKATIRSTVIEEENIDENKPGLLTNPPLDQTNGIWKLQPRKGENDFSEIHSYVACFIVKDTCNVTQPNAKRTPIPTKR